MDETCHKWKPNGMPFCWQPKAALRKIRDALDADNAVASGLLVYAALTEIASDKQARTFQTTHAYIAMKCGLSPRTVQQRIKDLTSIGTIRCDVPSLKAPATYTLLAIEPESDKQPVPRVEQPIPNDREQLQNDEQSFLGDSQRPKKAALPTLEESSEEHLKNDGKTPTALKPVERISHEQELGRIGKELERLGPNLSDHTPGTTRHNRVKLLLDRQGVIRKTLGVVA